MKTRLFALIFATILLAFGSVQAKSKVLLRLNLEKGSVYEMTMVTASHINQEMMGQKMKMEMTMQMNFNYEVLDVLANGNFLIDYSIMKMKMDMNMNGQSMNFDSDSSEGNIALNSKLKNLIGTKLKLELNPGGKVIQVDGIEEYIKSIAGDQQLAQSMQMFMSKDNFSSFFDQTFNYFPENEVSVGDKWNSSFKLPVIMNMETVMNFEVAEIQKNEVVLNINSDVNMDAPIEQGGMKVDMKMNGTQNGKMTIDTSDGCFRSQVLTQKFDMLMKMKNPQSGEDMEIPMALTSDINATMVKK